MIGAMALPQVRLQKFLLVALEPEVPDEPSIPLVPDEPSIPLVPDEPSNPLVLS